ncbi:MAG: hypothetical protein KZQ99_04275, partial [Candidatus Thiodiazotropha sp. (ex Dulcina madagascariensis)]|nr:hypothetical protein [Candidatus Thiodiazotropha sp. (ex Dulcina madagascariensis)]
MASIIGGEHLGLYNGSLGLFGGGEGQARVGRNGQSDRVYVNTATGNLVVQRRDEYLSGLGLDLALLRTYNSQAQFDDDNGDNWRLNVHQRLYGLTGTVNTTGSTITKVYGDGAEVVFTYDEALGYYVSSAGEGAHDTLSHDTADSTWRWSDGAPGVEERFDAQGRLIERRDADGNTLSYTYTGALITAITDASGQVTHLDYSNNNLTRIRTLSQGVEQSRVSYAYDASNRLSEVIVDLSPEDNAIADGHTSITRYTYDGDSTRIAAITHGDGAAIAFTYDAQGRVETLDQAGAITTFIYSQGGATQTLTANLIPEALTVPPNDPEPVPYYLVLAGDTWASIAQTVYGDDRAAAALEALFAGGGITTLTEGDQLDMPGSFTYEVTGQTGGAGQTDVQDPLGHLTSYRYDEAGLISEVLSPTIGGNRLSTRYSYDGSGNLTAVTDGNGHATAYAYNADGTLASQRDAEGNTLEYRYNVAGLLVNEIAYLTPDPDGAGAETAADPLVTRYVYDSEHHLRFVVSAEGRVEEHRYDATGQRLASISYLEGRYAVGALTPSDTLNEAALQSWSGGQDLSRAQRTDYGYDVRGNLSLTTRYAEVDNTGAGVAASAAITRYVYDQAGQLLTRIDPRGEATADANDFTTHYLYDGLGRLYSTTDALGQATLAQYDDANNRVITSLANGLATSQVYDSRGLLISEHRSAPDASPLGTTRYQYDQAGRLRVTTDPTGRRTHLLYDETGRQTAAIDTAGALTEYHYDDADRLIRTTGYATPLSETTLAGLLDVNGDPADIALDAIRPAASPEDRVTSNVYDAAGRLVRAVDAQGNVTLNQYDGLSRLTGSEQIDADAAGALELDITITNEGRDASQGNQRRDGTEGQDSLSGDVGDDTIYGRGGDDTLSGDAGRDILYGDAGADQIDGGIGNDTLYGGNDDDTLRGGAGDDRLYGDYGHDRLEGGGGADTLYGGRGNDTYYFERGFGQDTIDNNYRNYDANSNRTDVIQFGPGIDPGHVSAYRASNNLVLSLNDSEDRVTVINYFLTDATSRAVLDEIRFADNTAWTIDDVKLMVQQPSDGDDQLYAYGQGSLLQGAGGNDTLHGATGNDELAGGEGADTLNGNVGADTLNGGAGNDLMHGGNDADILTGGVGDDRLYGDLGDDRLEGGSGSDTLYGGRGNDTYYFERGFGQDTIDNNHQNYDANSSRTDVAEFGPGIAPADLLLSQSGNSLVIDLLDSGDRLTVSNYFLSNGTSRAVLDEIRFADGTAWSYADVTALLPTMTPPTPQTLNGDETPNLLAGGDGDDTLHGYGENDQLSGHAGADTIWGENGDDLLQGGAGNDSLYGGAGADILEGGLGNDTLSGDAGNDIYRFERGFGQDTVNNSDATAGRVDAIEFGADIAPAEIRALRVTSSLVLQLTGTDDQVTVNNYFIDPDADNVHIIDEIRFADGVVWDVDTVKGLVQQGSQSRDYLYAYTPGDTLQGEGGDDVLAGADGNDLLYGGVGTDHLSGNGGDDQLEGDAGDDDLYGHAGNDRLEGGTGGDDLWGGAGDDILVGGSGNDTLQGDAGNDTYLFELGFGQDTITNSDDTAWRIDAIAFGAGIASGDIRVQRSSGDLILALTGSEDRVTVKGFFSEDALDNPANNNADVIDEVRFSDGTRWSIDDIKSMALVSTEHDDLLYGYAGADNLIRGEGGDDTLYGNDRADVLYGGDDNDILRGAGGDDLLSGERDDDTLYGDAGHDELRGGAGADSFWGGTGDDRLLGGVGNDTLRGDAGDDTLTGGVGDDALYGGAGSDTYHFERGFGRDTINNYNHGGSADAVAARTDAIQFGAGIAPTDIWARRTGNDLYLYLTDSGDQVKVTNYFHSDATNKYVLNEVRFADGTVWSIDTVKSLVQQPSEWNDILYANSPGSLLQGAGGDDALYGDAGNDELQGGAGADRLWSRAGDDRLLGGVGNDTLYGEAGNDTLEGGVGDDILYGGNGNDTYHFERGFGRDTIDNSNQNSEAVGSRTDAIQFGAGIAAADVWARRYNDNLILHLKGADDQVTVSGYFSNNATSKDVVDEVRFVDGTVWDLDTVKNLVQQPSEWNDILYAYSPGSVLQGGGGDDALYGDVGNDDLQGGAGDDQLLGRAGDDRLLGGVGNDILYGDAGSDILEGGVGDDALYGGAGSDTYHFEQGFGRDTINNYNHGGSADAVANRTDAIQFGAGIAPTDVWARRTGDDLYLYLSGADDQVRVENYFRSDATDKYVLNEIRFADGTVWSIDTVKGLVQQPTGWNDTLYAYSPGSVLQGAGGEDTLYGEAGNDELQGGAGSDRLWGRAGDDRLLGGVGNDTLYGEAGNDTLEGGAGDDDLSGGNGSDTYHFERGFGRDRIDNGVHNSEAVSSRTDAIQFGAGIATTDVWVGRASNDLILSLIGANDQIRVVNYFSSNGASRYVLDAIRFADGASWSYSAVTALLSTQTLPEGQTLTGSEAADDLAGGGGDDTLYGHGADDTLAGNGGRDVFYGGDGNDLLQGGTGNDTLHGDAGADTLEGGADNDALHGGTGNDSLTGGLGDDVLNGGAGNDIYYFAPGFGRDTIAQQYAPEMAEADIVQFTAGINEQDVRAYRGASNDLILELIDTGDSLTVSNYFHNDGIRENGNTYQNTVTEIRFDSGAVWTLDDVKARAQQPTEANDTLYSYGSGGELRGGSGEDRLNGSSGSDHLLGERGSDTLYGAGGDDLLEGGTGNDTLRGEAGNDTLTGGVGDDTLYGGSGNDIYHFERGFGRDIIYRQHQSITAEADVIRFGAGITAADISAYRINWAGSSAHLLLALTGSSDSVLVANYFNNDAIQDPTDPYYNTMAEIRFADGTVWSIDDVKARVQQPSESNDTLYSYEIGGEVRGGGGKDTFYGSIGSDQLLGEGSDDTLYGGDGDDRLEGGAGNDSLRGDAGDDTLIGGVGDDLLRSGVGNDTYYFERGFGHDVIESQPATDMDEADVIQFAPGIAEQDIRVYRGTYNNLMLELIDTGDSITIYNYFDHDGLRQPNSGASQNTVTEIRFDNGTVWNTDDVKALVQQATESNDTLYSYEVGNELHGGEGKDTLHGASGDDHLLGEGSDDTLHGNGGDDRLEGGLGNDTLRGKAGDDTLEGGVGDDALDGDIGNDVLQGGSGNDLLKGRDGDDILNGGAGNDTLNGGSGNDTYRFERGFGRDTINNASQNTDANANRLDAIEFAAGIAPSDLSVGRYINDLILELVDNGDRLTVSNYFQNDGASKSFIDEIRFANGAVWRLADISARVGEVRHLQRTTLSWPAGEAGQELGVYVSIDGGVFTPLLPSEGSYTLVLDELAQGAHRYTLEYRDQAGNLVRQGSGEFQVYGSGSETQVAALESVAVQEDFRATRYYYDADGRLTAELDGDGYLTEYRYDGAGNRLERIRRAQPLDIGRLRRSDAVLEDNPVGYWKFDETEGLVATDVSGNGLDGYYNTAVGLGNPGAVTGGGTAASFDGASGTLADLGNSGSLQFDNGTVEAWINTGNAGSYNRTILAKHNAFGLYLANNQLVAIDWSSNTTLESGVNLADGQWHHVSMTFESGVASGTRLYVDGVETAVGTTQVAGHDASLKVGGGLNNGAGNNFTGLIDEVALFDRVLTAEQIQRHANPAGRASADNLGQALTSITPAASADDQSSYNFYDAQGRRIGSLDAQGFLTGFVYDGAGNLTQSTRFSAAILDYDPATDTFATLKARAIGLQDRTTDSEYDPLNQLVAQTDPASGTRGEFAYDAVGQRVAETQGLAANDVSEARGQRVRYDLQGRLTGELNGEGSRLYNAAMTDAEVAALYQQYGVSYAYDEAGRRISTTDANGHTVTYHYDQAGHLTHTVNHLGEVVEARYNAFGEIQASIGYGARIDTTGLLGGTVSAELLDRVALIADAARDRRATFAYDRLGQLREQIDAEGFATRFVYNAFGEIESQTRTLEQATAENQLAQDRTVTDRFDYNKRGMLTDTTLDAHGVQATTRARYDAFGRLVEQIDGEGNLTATRYEDSGRTIVIQDPLGREQRSEMDAFGRVLVQRDGLGNETRYSYDDAQRSVTVTTPEGIAATTFHNRHGETLRIEDGNGQVTTYEYDLDGRLRFVRRLLADGSEVVNESRYDQTGLLLDTLDGNGNRTHYAYDAADRVLTRTVDADGLQLTTRYAYDALGNQVEMTDANNVVTQTAFDRNGRQVSVTLDPNGLNLVTLYETDGDGNVVRVRQGDGTDPAQYEQLHRFDGLGRRIQTVVDPEGLALSDSFVYDDDGRAVARIDANGNATRFIHDQAGQERYRIDAEGGVTENRYDAAGRLIETVDYLNEASLPADDHQLGEAQLLAALTADPARDRHTFFVYDSDDRLVYTINGLGEVSEFRYDGNGNVVERIQYDRAIAPQADMQPTDVAAALSALGYSDTEWFNAERSHTLYDSLGRARFTIDALGHVKENRYDANGNRVRTLSYAQPISFVPGSSVAEVAALLNGADPGNRATHYLYDGADRLRYSVDDLGYVVERRYDALGNLTDTIGYAQAIDPGADPTLGSIQALLPALPGSADRHQRQAFDAANRQTAAIDAEGAETRYGYDAAGHRTSLTDRLGNVSRFVYDGAGRQRYGVDAEGGVNERRYDAAGQVVETIRYEQAVDAGGWALQIDAAQLQGALQPDPALDNHRWFAYDAAGRQVFQVDGTGHVTENRYHGQLDADGKAIATAFDRGLYDTLIYDRAIPVDGEMSLAGIRSALEAGGYGSQTWYEYANTDLVRGRTFLDALGRAHLRIDGEGRVTETDYNANGDIERTRLYRNRVDLALITSEAALRDNLIANPVFRETEYRYDRNGRLTHTIEDPNGLAITREQRYNAHGEVVNAIDANGNATRRVYDGLGQLRYTVDASGSVTESRYDAAGRVVETVGYANRLDTALWGDEVTQAQIESALVEAAQDRHTWLTYDREGRQRYSLNSLGGVVENRYDAKGNRIETIAYDQRLDATLTEKSNQGIAAALQSAGYTAGQWFNASRSRFFHDNLDRQRYQVNSEGIVTESRYDGRGNLTHTIAHAGTVNYDGSTTLAGLTSQLNSTDPDNRQSWTLYNANNRAQFSIDAEGRVRENRFDSRGNILTQTLLAGVDAREFHLSPGEYSVVGLQQAINAYARYDNPLALWSLDETTGSVLADVSGNNRHGAYSVDISGTPAGASEVVPGYAADALTHGEGAIDFHDGLSARVSSAGLQPNRLSLEAWVRLTDAPEAGTWTSIISAEDRGGWSLGIDASNNLSFRVHTSQGLQTLSATPLALDQAHHLAASFDGQTMRLYIDGELAASQELGALYDIAYAGSNPDATVDVFLGAEANTNNQAGRYQSLILDDVAIYDRALDASVIARHHDYGANARVSHNVYDANNRLLRTVDSEGMVIDNSYDAAGNRLANSAYATPVTLDPDLAIAQQPVPAHPADRATQHTYDAADRLIRSVDAEGYTTAYTYDDKGNRLTRTLYLDKSNFTDPALQQITRYTYDAQDRLVSEIDPLNIETRRAYDSFGNIERKTEAFGSADSQVWRYRYDNFGRLREEENPEAVVTRYSYSTLGQVTEQRQGYGRNNSDGRGAEQLTQNRYDTQGRLLEQTHADGTQTRYSYDAFDQVRQTIEAAGSADERIIASDYDRVGRLTDQTLAFGAPEAVSRHIDYDAFGNKIRDTEGYGSADARVTHYAYDRRNRLVSETDANGAAVAFEYDAFGNITRRSVTNRADQRVQQTDMAYDARDRLISESNGEAQRIERVYDGADNLRFETQAAGAAEAVVTEYRYDQGNRLREQIIDPSGLGLTTRYTYDDRNNLLSETDPRGNAASSQYDLMDRVVQVTDGEGFSTGFEYDIHGNQIAIATGRYLGADPDKAAIAKPATTRFAYDQRNRQTYQVDALGVVTQYDYDARGNRIRQTDAHALHPAGQAIDEAEMTPIADTQARVTEYRYNLADQRVDEIQPSGTVVRHEYTGAGEIRGKTLDYGVGDGFINATTRYFYDAGGRLAYEVDPLDNVTHYAYDDFGNLIQVTRALDLGQDGLPSAEATAGMQVTRFEYDLANRLTAEIVDPDGLALRSGFEYDARGNQSAIIDANGNRGELVYDKADRLIWERDAEGHIVRRQYDANGNKLSEIRYVNDGAALNPGQLPAAHGADQTTAYAYDARNRLVARTDPRGVVNQLVYDALGNVLEERQNATELFDAPARVTRYSYNLANLLEEETAPHGQVTRFEYDKAYNLIRQAVENTWADSLNLDAQGEPTPVSALQVTAFSYDLNNHLTDQIVDPDGLALHTRYQVDALGNRIAEIGPNAFAAIESDVAWARQIRRDLGLVDAAGDPLAAAALSAAQQQTLLDAHTARGYYDAAGNVVYQVDTLGQVRELVYDDAGNRIRAVQYAHAVDTAALDAHTPPTLVADPDNDRSVEYRFDAAGREIATRFDEVTLADGSAVRPELSQVYDGVGNVAQAIDANGNVTYSYYDSRGQVVAEIDAEGFLTRNDYDAFGNLITETRYLDRQPLSTPQKADLDPDAYAPVGPSRVVEHAYDDGNHRINTRYPAADLYSDGVERQNTQVEVDRTFDAFGNRLSETVMHAVSESAPAATHYRYDVNGRLTQQIEARADQLLSLDDAYHRELRQELGYVNAAGEGKTAAQLSADEIAAIRADHTTAYDYDAAGNLREQRVGDRITTFEYDLNNRNTRVHFPAYDRVDVQADGSLDKAAGFRALGEIDYDAFGNRVREVKANGEEIHYRYDQANRKTVAIDDAGVYTEYGYNLAGERILTHRFYNRVVDPLSAETPVIHTEDQVIEYDYDRMGRLLAERRLGDPSVTGDDRTSRYGYDANGNTLQVVDGRGFTNTLAYDGLNRLTQSISPTGAVTAMTYDALGNVLNRDVGGFTAPSFNSSFRATPSSAGVLLEWTTNRAGNGTVYLRPLGTHQWQAFADDNLLVSEHRLEIDGLAANTTYEFYALAQDSGYTLTTDTWQFTTATGADNVTVENLSAIAGGHSADIRFSLPGAISGLELVIGAQGADPMAVANAQGFTPVNQGGEAYLAAVNFTTAPQDAVFQLRWTDANGHRNQTRPTGCRAQNYHRIICQFSGRRKLKIYDRFASFSS